MFYEFQVQSHTVIQAYLLYSGLRSYLRKTFKPTTVMSLPVVQMLGLLMEEIRGFMVFNATFNNISAISWRSVLLVEETGVPIENHRPGASR